MVKYALHPGYVRSKSDGQDHYVGVAQLARLYQLGPTEYCVWQEPHNLGRHWDDYVHLYPDYDGNYGRPEQR